VYRNGYRQNQAGHQLHGALKRLPLAVATGPAEGDHAVQPAPPGRAAPGELRYIGDQRQVQINSATHDVRQDGGKVP